MGEETVTYFGGLLDGYRLEQDRIQMMRKEKEEEKKIGRRRKNIMTEWEQDLR